jgi:hypothetical protein
LSCIPLIAAYSGRLQLSEEKLFLCMHVLWWCDVEGCRTSHSGIPAIQLFQHVTSRGDSASLEPIRSIVVQLLKAGTAKPKVVLVTVEKCGSTVHMQFYFQEIKALTV